MTTGELALLGVVLSVGCFFLMVNYLQGNLPKRWGHGLPMAFVCVLSMIACTGLMVVNGISWLEHLPR